MFERHLNFMEKTICFVHFPKDTSQRGTAREIWCDFSVQPYCLRVGKGARWAAAMMIGLRREFQ